jgi:hypothetical protein
MKSWKGSVEVSKIARLHAIQVFHQKNSEAFTDSFSLPFVRFLSFILYFTVVLLLCKSITLGSSTSIATNSSANSGNAVVKKVSQQAFTCTSNSNFCQSVFIFSFSLFLYLSILTLRSWLKLRKQKHTKTKMFLLKIKFIIFYNLQNSYLYIKVKTLKFSFVNHDVGTYRIFQKLLFNFMIITFLI